MQPSKASSPIEVTLFGITTLVSPVQFLKAEEPIVVTLLGIVKLESFLPIAYSTRVVSSLDYQLPSIDL